MAAIIVINAKFVAQKEEAPRFSHQATSGVITYAKVVETNNSIASLPSGARMAYNAKRIATPIATLKSHLLLLAKALTP